MQLNTSFIKDSDKILIAFSGGKDSIVLLDLLLKIVNKKQIAIAHINHQIREASYKDALFSKKIAQKYKIKYFETRLNLKNLNSNIEAIAREKRYKALYQIAEKNDYNKIATAHTKSDNIEQFFIRLYRGTSLSGLAGISENRDIIIRPLLDFTTTDIKNYIVKHNLEHIEDETNFQNIYLRNKIRNEILPRLNIENYDLHTHIINLMEQIKKDNEYFDGILNNFIDKNLHIFKDFIFFDINLHNSLPNNIKNRLIHLILYKFFNTSTSYNKISEILACTDESMTRPTKAMTLTTTPIKLQITKEINFYSDKNYIAIYRNNNNILSIDETKKLFEIIKEKISFFRNCELNDLFINENIKLINFTNGDKFKKYNNKEIKLKDIFIDHKIPIFLRKIWPLLSLNNEIIAIPFIEKGYYYNPNHNKK